MIPIAMNVNVALTEPATMERQEMAHVTAISDGLVLLAMNVRRDFNLKVLVTTAKRVFMDPSAMKLATVLMEPAMMGLLVTVSAIAILAGQALYAIVVQPDLKEPYVMNVK